jgi:lipoprotein-releasing system permease protein
MLFRIASRYLRFRRPFGAVQRIALVSMLSMAVGTAALVIVLSVFNGFESFIKNLYTDYYPDVCIVPKSGKTIPNAPFIKTQLEQQKNIVAFSETSFENALLSFDQQQVIAKLKGVDTQYAHVVNMANHILYGEYNLSGDSTAMPMLMGVQMANRLGVSNESVLPVTCYTFSEQDMLLPGGMPAYQTNYGTVRGLFAIDEVVDREIVLVPLWFVQQLRNNNTQCSAFEIKLKPGTNIAAWTQSLQQNQAFQALSILPREAQNPTLYKVLNSERWAVFAILSLMLLIASFTIIGALSMLVIEKQKDIAMLKALGLREQQLRGLFLRTGVLLSCMGAAIGMLLAYALCLGQQTFGWIRMGNSDNLRLDAYPVAFRWSDAILVALVVVCVALIASWFPANRAAKRPISLRVR